jgi:hypothetical protein
MFITTSTAPPSAITPTSSAPNASGGWTAAPIASSRPQPTRLRDRPVWVPHRSAKEPATAFVAAAPNSATDRSNPKAPSETPNDALMSDAETAHAPQKNPKHTNPAATGRSDPRTAIDRACHHRISVVAQFEG